MPSVVEICFVIQQKIIKRLFRYYLPLEKDVAHHLNKLEYSSSKDVLCKVWLKFSRWILKKIMVFKCIINLIVLFCYYLPLEKGVVLEFFLNKLESPFTKGCFMQSVVEIGTVFQEKKTKI